MKKKASTQGGKAIRQRFCLVLQALFGGSQSQMAVALQVSQSAVCQIVKGRVPGTRVLQAVCRATDATMEWFRTGEGDKPTRAKPCVSEFKSKAKAIVARISKARDELNNLIEEYGDILQSVTDATDHFEQGLDEISRYL